MVKDLQTNGGKNLAHLNTILSVVQKAESQNALPASAQTQLESTSRGLQALQGIAEQFGTAGNAEQVATTITNSIPLLTKATGLNSADLKGMLPSPYDSPSDIQTKLSAIQAQIDQNTHEKVQSTLDTVKNS